MSQNEVDGCLAEDHKKLVAAAVPPIALEESRIQETLRRALAEVRWRQTKKRLALVLAPILLLTLVAAGVWRWSGRNSAKELAFGGAITVTHDPAAYPFETVRAACGKIWRDANGILKILVQQGAITPELRAEIVDSIDRAEPTGDAYEGGFEELSARVRTGQTLAPEELARLTGALRAGISAIRETAVHDDAHAGYAKILCDRLRSQVTGEAVLTPEPKQVAPEPKKDQGPTPDKGRD